MNLSLLPISDTIPAPWWIFESLNIITFTIHILLVNIVIGGSLIALFSGIRDRGLKPDYIKQAALIRKIPSSLALAINFGVALLLFIQALYGRLLYTSSVIIAVHWLLLIPLLIIAYYCAYIYTHNENPGLINIAITASSIIVLWIAFVFVNNMTLMLQPEKWSAYFTHKTGTFLNYKDPTIIPRYLHFLTASVAVAGLSSALLAHFKKNKNKFSQIKNGLKIFTIATIFQIIVGLFFFLSLPNSVIMIFLSKNIFYPVILAIGIFLGLSSIVLAFKGRLIPASAHLIATVVAMVITRANIRSIYLDKVFDVKKLPLNAQYGAMIVFLASLIIVILAVRFMLALAFNAEKGRSV